ncbi:MAG: hypothetical protein LKG27_06090 [Clostridiaceae bacterium]|jgi:hypothetical protein|nr:hypothetical protein [Clostridiaceae bacterium]
MKTYLKSLILIFCSLVCVSFLSACTNDKMIGMPNPWKDCNDDLKCAAKVAGFEFPMTLSNYTVRAMKDMIQITYPLDETRDLVVRKSSTETNNGDISGDYNEYPIKEQVSLPNGVIVHIRRDKKLVYVMYFSAESGYYSINCDKGMTMKEVYGAYKVIAEAEEPKLPPEVDK